MQKAAKEQIIPIRFARDEISKIDKLAEKSGMRSRSEFIREAVRHYLDTVSEMKIITIRKISKEQAKKEILEFIKHRKEADTFDIANELRLDVGTTIKALKELWEEGKVR
ncbi:MAG: ribbon-helix-helix domain-containing protein [Nitrososphaerales archaeon]